MSIFISSVTIPENRQRKDLGDLDGLIHSISRRGLLNPIVIDRNNVLIAGRRRLAACSKLGWTHIEHSYIDELDEGTRELIELEENTRRKDLTWQERHQAIIRVTSLLKELHPEWSEEEIGDEIGIARKTVNEHNGVEKFLHNPLVAEADSFGTARNAARRLSERQIADELNMYVAQGAVYTPASSIINADFHTWSAEYDGPKFNLIHCDFPYGINSHLSGQNPSGYTDGPDDYFHLIRSLAVNLERFCADSAHIIFWFSPTYFCQTWELLKLLDGFHFDELPLIWVRDDQRGVAPDTQRRPRRIYETAFFGWRNDRKIIRVKNNAFVGPSPSGDHAHEKSEAALSYFFEMLVDSQTSILDPTCGSGSALRAAHKLGAARVLGIESNGGFATDAKRTFETYLRSSQRRPEDHVDLTGPSTEN